MPDNKIDKILHLWREILYVINQQGNREKILNWFVVVQIKKNAYLVVPSKMAGGSEEESREGGRISVALQKEKRHNK